MNKLFKILALQVISVGTLSINFNKEVTESKEYLNKIVFENCQNVLMDKDAEVNQDEYYSLTIRLNYEELDARDFNDDEGRKEEFSRQKQYYTSNNNKIVQQLDLSQFSYVYVSKYAPYISIDTTYSELSKNDFSAMYKLAKNDWVRSVYVNIDKDVTPNLLDAKESVGVLPYIENEVYDGGGIVVGVLEPGIIDVNHSNFSGYDVTARRVWYFHETVTEHSTIVASIITGVYGIAPLCKLLSVQLSGDAVSEIDWLLDNNVNIINCSYGDENPTGSYSSKSAYMDYIAYTYKVSFVCSAGNEGETLTNVCNPGLGYNVLTVGACNKTSGGVMTFSSYNVVSGPRKPDVVAPGNNIVVHPFGSKTGTSISAPVVTGCLALMMQRTPALKFLPSLAYAAFYASCNNMNSRSFGSGFNNYGGAGVINFENYDSRLGCYGYYNEYSQNDIYGSGCGFYARSGDKVRMSLHWLAKATGTASSTEFTNYDLYLYDSNQNVVAIEQASDNKEFMELTITTTGSYTFKAVRQNTLVQDNERVAMNYSIIRS